MISNIRNVCMLILPKDLSLSLIGPTALLSFMLSNLLVFPCLRFQMIFQVALALFILKASQVT